MTRPDNQQSLDALERDIRSLQIEFARYFAGDSERPPLKQREDLEAEVRRLRQMPNASTAQRFRFNSLVARLGTLNELHDRRLRQHQARTHQHQRPTDAVVAGSERGTKAVRRLFLELYKEEQPTASISSFERFLEKKVSEIRSRTGCSSVQFRVVDNDGRRTLKAKPLGRTAAASSE
jgi:hypothetical protein